jgi:hypothetical protein
MFVVVVVVVAGCAVGVRWKGNGRVPFRQRLIAMSNMFLLALTSRCHSIPQLLHDWIPWCRMLSAVRTLLRALVLQLLQI